MIHLGLKKTKIETSGTSSSQAKGLVFPAGWCPFFPKDFGKPSHMESSQQEIPGQKWRDKK